MPQFLLLLWEDEAAYRDPSDPVYGEVIEAHGAFGAKHGASIRGGEALGPQASAKLVRDGVVTDGPFLETKEALGGYYVVEADDLDAAVEIAKDVPARFGFAEVRPVMVFD